MSHTAKGTALILGATGRFGKNMELALRSAGWKTVSFNRKTDDLSVAAQTADLIVHGWNPTYDRWATEVPKLTAQVIKAARESGATVLIPGNVYVYGEKAPAVWSENTPHLAENGLGRIRIEMEAALRESGVKTILLRGGDFLDTKPSGNWFDLMIAKPLSAGAVNYPGDPSVEHSWAYLPDFCRALAELAGMRAELDTFTSLNYAGYTMSGMQMAEILGARVKKMKWLPLVLLTPFWKVARHLLEMKYLWNKPHRLDGAGFKKLLPDFQETPVNEALHRAASFKINPNQPVIGARAAV